MRLALDLFTLCAVALGALFFLAGTLGLLRFPDTLTRLHALTKADNLGLGLVVLGLLPQVSGPLGWLGLIAVWLMALLSGATVGQLLARALRGPETVQKFAVGWGDEEPQQVWPRKRLNVGPPSSAQPTGPAFSGHRREYLHGLPGWDPDNAGDRREDPGAGAAGD